jgi:hypothetical protein
MYVIEGRGDEREGVTLMATRIVRRWSLGLGTVELGMVFLLGVTIWASSLEESLLNIRPGMTMAEGRALAHPKRLMGSGGTMMSMFDMYESSPRLWRQAQIVTVGHLVLLRLCFYFPGRCRYMSRAAELSGVEPCQQSRHG